MLLCGLLLMLGHAAARAQETPPDAAEAAERADPAAHRDTLDIFAAQPFALRPFVLPGSERILVDGAPLDTSQYRLDYRRGRLWLRIRPPGGDARLVAVYRTFPFAFRDVYRRRRLATRPADSTGALAVVVEEERADTAGADGFNPFAGLTLERSGSITRGVIAGSQRDVAVESGLRLQLAGEVAEDVRVQAVLTDENTPIQPEGTTERLRDFDRVFVEIAAPQGTARLGDVDVAFGGTEFARFDRKLQGAAVTTGWNGPAEASWLGAAQITAAAATARGRYRRQDIEPIDGVQGPYRLTGQNDERFILVIAGSEEVYLDGERLVRGETNDYTIDYALAEITFTPRRLITADRRLTVEFEYTTEAFTRTTLGTEARAGFLEREDGRARLALGAAFIREADSRQFGGAFDFSPEDSLLVAQAGDAEAVRSGAERVLFDPEATYVQYRREVRPGADGTADTVFVALERAPEAGTPVFRVRFERVGEGEGSYARAGRAANGILYEYEGLGEGAYAPVRRLPSPKQQRLLDLNGQFEPARGVVLFGEWARSLNDPNRLSALGDADDRGDAYVAGARLEAVPLDLGALSFGALDEITFSGEYRRTARGEGFATFDRTRPVEFGRKWNLDARASDPSEMLLAAGGAETMDEAALRLDLAPEAHLAGEAGRLHLGNAFSAWRRAAEAALTEERWPEIGYRAEYVTSENALLGEDGAWLRQRGAVEETFGRFTPRLEVEHERRRQTDARTDSLLRRSFAFAEWRPGLAYETDRFAAAAEVEWRTEDEAAGGRFRDASVSWTAQTDLKYNASKSFDTEARVGYHVRRFADYFRINEKRGDTESIALQSKTRWRPFDRAVEIDAFYEALTKRTPTLQEIYVRTGAEVGQYVWQDANGDGLLQIDEFIPERTPNEGIYVKTFVPSDSLEPVTGVEARLRLRLDPARAWRSASARWKRLFAHVETQTTLEVTEENRAADLAQIYLLNLSRFQDPETTQRGRLRVGQDVHLFRRALGYGLDLSFDRVRSLNGLAAGAEERLVQTWRAEGRYEPAEAWGLRLEGRLGRNRSESGFEARQYDIRSVEVEPEVAYQAPGSPWRMAGGVALARKRDDVGARRVRLVKVPVEARLALKRRLQLTARGEVARVDLDGEAAAGLAEFELTDGRGPGTSLLWGLDGQYAFTDYLRATLAYDGRSFSDAPAINTLRLSLSASF